MNGPPPAAGIRRADEFTLVHGMAEGSRYVVRGPTLGAGTGSWAWSKAHEKAGSGQGQHVLPGLRAKGGDPVATRAWAPGAGIARWRTDHPLAAGAGPANNDVR